MRRATRNISNGAGCLLTAAGLCMTLGVPRAAAAQQTAEGKSAWSTIHGRWPNTLSAKAWPSRIATGVRFTRLVQSPTA